MPWTQIQGNIDACQESGPASSSILLILPISSSGLDPQLIPNLRIKLLACQQRMVVLLS